MSKKLMIQGTMSGVGKSLLTAGLLRVFARDGYRCAPFKSQNMALNSYVTRDGLEIGRAQALQAEAAFQEPTVSMNPILLKPDSDTGSQVIVNGEILADMSAREYFSYKKKLIPTIREAFASLEKDNDLIIIEGAGSPAEINLRSDDIVNMGLAELIDAPVLLVGDIDRGGVFAQLYGTASLLSDSERSRLKGFLINKFRGDVTLLTLGIREIEEKCALPSLGVLPYLSIELDEEDSLSDRFRRKTNGSVNVRIVRLPHLSNYTDFDVLFREPTLGVSYVDTPEALDDADLVILPGTKNTPGDLCWLRETKIAEKLLTKSRENTLILGICGGYQMLGETVGRDSGLSLLPIQTSFAEKKTLTRRTGTVPPLPKPFQALTGKPYDGYEIHTGITTQGSRHPTGDAAPETQLPPASASSDRPFTTNNTTLGTYLHGLFEDDDFRHAFLSLLCEWKGLPKPPKPKLTRAAFRAAQFDLLEDAIRRHLDLDKIRRIVEESA